MSTTTVWARHTLRNHEPSHWPSTRLNRSPQRGQLGRHLDPSTEQPSPAADRAATPGAAAAAGRRSGPPSLHCGATERGVASPPGDTLRCVTDVAPGDRADGGRRGQRGARRAVPRPRRPRLRGLRPGLRARRPGPRRRSRGLWACCSTAPRPDGRPCSPSPPCTTSCSPSRRSELARDLPRRARRRPVAARSGPCCSVARRRSLACMRTRSMQTNEVGRSAVLLPALRRRGARRGDRTPAGDRGGRTERGAQPAPRPLRRPLRLTDRRGARPRR